MGDILLVGDFNARIGNKQLAFYELDDAML